jgi:hypothetical protein
MAEGKIVATLKAGDKYDAPWITVGADTPEEVAALVERAGQAGLGAIVANAARGFQGTYAVAGAATVTQVGYEQNAAPVAVQAGPVAPTAAPPVAAQAAPAAPAPTAPQAEAKFCPHGQRTLYNGTKNGRAYTAFFCPLPKGHPDQCGPVWG